MPSVNDRPPIGFTKELLQLLVRAIHFLSLKRGSVNQNSYFRLYSPIQGQIDPKGQLTFVFKFLDDSQWMQKVKLINWDPFGLIQNMLFFYEFFLKTPVTFRLLSPQSFYNTLAGTGAKYCMFLQHPEFNYLNLWSLKWIQEPTKI